MSTVEEIEAAIQQLSPDEMAAFRAWYAEFDAAAWERQIAEDEAAGRLDWLMNEALDDLDAGRCTDRCGCRPVPFGKMRRGIGRMFSCLRWGETTVQSHRIDGAVSAVLFLACAVFNLLFSPIGESVDEHRVWLPSLAMGSIVVQPMLIALLASLSPSFVTLLPCAISACVILGYTACVTSWRVLTSAHATDGVTAYGLDALMAFLLGFAAASLVFLLIRRCSSSGIESRLTSRPIAGSEGFAARGRSIHAWTSGVAVLVATACIAHLARESSVAGANGPLVARMLAGNMSAVAAQVATVLLLMCLVYTPVVPVVWSALAFPHGMSRLLVAALGVWAVLGLICFKAFRSDEASGTMGVVFGATAAGLLMALALRRCGYHMRLGEHLAC